MRSLCLIICQNADADACVQICLTRCLQYFVMLNPGKDLSGVDWASKRNGVGEDVDWSEKDLSDVAWDKKVSKC